MTQKGVSIRVCFLKLCSACLLFIGLFPAGLYAAENFSYDSHGRRDPFVSLMAPGNPSASSLESIESAEDIRLEGIAVGAGGENIAIMNGEMVKVKSKVGNVFIKSIAKKEAVVIINGTEYKIQLSEGGVKSE